MPDEDNGLEKSAAAYQAMLDELLRSAVEGAPVEANTQVAPRREAVWQEWTP